MDEVVEKIKRQMDFLYEHHKEMLEKAIVFGNEDNLLDEGICNGYAESIEAEMAFLYELLVMMGAE